MNKLIIAGVLLATAGMLQAKQLKKAIKELQEEE